MSFGVLPEVSRLNSLHKYVQHPMLGTAHAVLV